ncbi:CobW family GTP-binding protein [Gemmata sp.]|uniref:CobW family GTP-binding protein n=1 Tax=Gemmata sp. TaxID=1914242 RepID=UPI003F6EBC2C
MTIPVNLITGFLGVGKTTAVIDLLKNKAAGSRWAVLVNEYGDVSIDGAMIEGSGPDGVSVREVGGGCVCCATAPYLPVAIHFLLLDAKPDRLIIETTGLGHPARLLDMLRQNYADRLDVRATLGIVDPADFAKPEMRANPIFVDQVQLSDVVVMNKLDTATPELVGDFQAWAEGLFPPKLLIAGTTNGRLDPAWLDLTSNDERLPLFPEAHAHHHHDESAPIAMGGLAAKPGAPVRYPSPPGVLPACCGWVFHADDVFDENKLLALLSGTKGVARLKGVFHLPDEWEAVNRSGTAVSVAPTAYRRDSRLEVFSDALDWAAFERELVGCLLAPIAPR